jgi:hypothetical protein
MATETSGIAALDNANSAIMNPAIHGSPTPNPSTMQAPVTSQTRASGVPISQNARQRAIFPVSNLARNFIG